MSSDVKRGAQRGKILSALFLVALVGAAVACLPVFRLAGITVAGNRYLSKAEICRIAGVSVGQHILEVETDTAAKTLMKDLRIQRAAVRRLLPNALVIEIEERRPIANMACDYGYVDLGSQGVVLQAYRTRHDDSPLPFLDGSSLGELYIGDTVDDPLILDMLQYLSRLDAEHLGQIVSANLANPAEIVVHTSNTVEIRLGDLSRLDDKARLTKSFLDELRVTKYQIEYVDLRYAAPFVKFRKT